MNEQGFNWANILCITAYVYASYCFSWNLWNIILPEVCILKETKSKGSCLDLGKLADQLYNKKNLNIRMTNNMTHVVEGEMFL